MPRFKFIFVLLLLFGFSVPVYSGELRLDYSSFYSHLRKLDNDELGTLQFAFGFLNVRSKQLCSTQNVMIHTDKKDIPIEVTPDKRFVLPSEKALKLAKAEVRIQLKEVNNQCDLSVLLQVKPTLLKDGVNNAELQTYFVAFDSFFDKMGGFLSFMMPSPDGLHLHFKSGSKEPASFSDILIQEAAPDTFTLMGENIQSLPAELKWKDIYKVTVFIPES